MKYIIYPTLCLFASMAFGSGPTHATLTNYPATYVGTNYATCNGGLLSAGGEACYVDLYTSTVDGVWAAKDKIVLGGGWTNGDSVLVPLTDLGYNTQYFYTFTASNSAGTVTGSPASVSFGTVVESAGAQDAGSGAVTNAFIVGTNAAVDMALITGSASIVAPVLSTNSWFLYLKTNALLWYSFDQGGDYTRIIDRTTNHLDGYAYQFSAPVGNFFTNDAFKVDSIFRSGIRTPLLRSVVSNMTDITIAMWINLQNSVTPVFVSPFSESTNSSPEPNLAFLNNSSAQLACSVASTIPWQWNAYFSASNTLGSESWPLNGAGYAISAGSWHRVVLEYSKRGSATDFNSYTAIWVDDNVVYASTSAKGLFITLDYLVSGYAMSYSGAFTPMLIDDLVVDRHYWYPVDVSNDYYTTRSRTLILP